MLASYTIESNYLEYRYKISRRYLEDRYFLQNK